MIEVSKAVIEKDNKFLLLKRAAHSKSFPDLWDFAGGKHEPGETPRQAVIRETKEETNYEIEPGREIKTIKYQNLEWEILFHYFKPKTIEGELKLSPDHSAYRWVTRAEIAGLKLHPAVILFYQ